MSAQHPNRKSVSPLLSDEVYDALKRFAELECQSSVTAIAGQIIQLWLRDNYDDSLPEHADFDFCDYELAKGGQCQKRVYGESKRCAWHKQHPIEQKSLVKTRAQLEDIIEWLKVGDSFTCAIEDEGKVNDIATSFGISVKITAFGERLIRVARISQLTASP